MKYSKLIVKNHKSLSKINKIKWKSNNIKEWNYNNIQILPKMDLKCYNKVNNGKMQVNNFIKYNVFNKNKNKKIQLKYYKKKSNY